MGIPNQIGAVFVPVSNIDSARDWYCRLLGLEPVEVLFGHLAVLPVREGSGLVLDSKDYVGPHDRKPMFHFDTRDIQAAHAQLEQLGAESLGPITDGVFFTFKDPDGNLLMVANVPPEPRN